MAINDHYGLIRANYEMVCLEFFCQGQPTSESKLDLFFLSLRASLGLKVITKLVSNTICFRKKPYKAAHSHVNLTIKGELQCKMNLWSNYTLLPSQPLSEICFHDCRM